MYYARSLDGGATFQPAVVVATESTWVRNTHLTYNGGYAHVAWDVGNDHTAYSRSRDGTSWSAPVNVHDDYYRRSDIAARTGSSGRSLTIIDVSTPGHGVLEFDAVTQRLVYTPTQDFNGMDGFTYTVSDGALTDTGYVSVTVAAVNDPPTAGDDTPPPINEDSSDNVLDVLSNDTFAPDTGETLTVHAVGTALHGTAVNSDTSVLYTPDPDFFGSDVFTYTLSDGHGGYDTATITVTVENTNNDPPTAVDDVIPVDEDSGDNVLDVLSNDSSDPDPVEPLSIYGVSDPTHGTAVNAGTHITYTPDAEFHGTDVFDYVLHDGNSGYDTAAITVTVNSQPEQVTFVYHDLEDVVYPGDEVAIVGDVTGGWGDLVPMAADAGHGVFSTTLTLQDGEAYDYKYVVNDGVTNRTDWLNTANRTLSLSTQRRVDDYRHVTVSTATLHAPATDVISLGETTQPIYGCVTIPGVTNLFVEGRGIRAVVGYGANSDLSSWTWEPMAFHTAVDSENEFTGVLTPTSRGVFSYVVAFDGNWGAVNPHRGWTYGDLSGVPPFSLTDAGLLTVLNNPPLAFDNAYTIVEDSTATGNVIADDTGPGADSDPDGDPLTAVLDEDVAVDKGTLGFDPDGSFIFTPTLDYYGIVTFTYHATDAISDSNTALVTITVTAENDAPEAVDDNAATTEETPVLVDVLANDDDADGDPLTLNAVGVPDVGTAVLSNTQVLYTPENRLDTYDAVLTYTISDGAGEFATATVTISVSADDDVPLADAGEDQLVDAGVAVTLDGRDSYDPEGTALSYLWTQTGGGPVALSDITAVTPTFTTMVTHTVLTFSLTVSDGMQQATDEVVVQVDTDRIYLPVVTREDVPVAQDMDLLLPATIDRQM
jgi:hypothetical protein